MLCKLLSRMDREVFANHVVSLTIGGPMAGRIESLGVGVRSLGMRRGVPDPMAIWRLKMLIKQVRPDIIQTWMYHADLIGGIAARLAGKIPVVWNIRHSNLDSGDNKKTTLWTAKACALSSKTIPERIVCCSEASRRIHYQIGYNNDRMLVIPNGFDLEAFQPDKEARDSFCHGLGIDQGALLLGMAARFNPQKDHYTLIQAAGILKEQGLDLRIILCGKDIDWDNAQLKSWIKEADLEDGFFLLGPRDDMPRITAALDIALLSSAHGEGFPNVLGEAMACGVPCVATDVGDSGEIIGDTGFVVPPRSPQFLAEALQEMVKLGPDGRGRLGQKARHRVRERFALGRVAGMYENLYKEIAPRRTKGQNLGICSR